MTTLSNSVNGSELTLDLAPSTRSGIWKFFIALGVIALILVLASVVGGELASFAKSALPALPFAAIAAFAFLGAQRPAARVLVVLSLAGFVLVLAVLAAGLPFTNLLAEAAAAGTPGVFEPTPESQAQCLSILGGILISLVAASVTLIRGVRQAAARVLPINPESYVHAVALFTVVAMTLIALVPLAVFGMPPAALLPDALLNSIAGEDGASLRYALYGLAWMIPCTILAVGYGTRRNLKDSLARLGVERPTWRQVGMGVGIAVAMVLVVPLLNLGIGWLWELVGWPTTDGDKAMRVMVPSLTLLSAMVISLVAGVGEELAVRGVLQPRLGLWVSSLFFAAMHAFQYHWDVLLIIFLVSVVLGVVRIKTNTTTAAIVHFTYDFLLISAAVFLAPWFQ